MYPEPLTLVRESNECIQSIKGCKITRIECFQLDCELSDKLLPEHGTDCHCGLLTISTNMGTCGFGQFEMSSGSMKGDFVQWAVVYQGLKGLTLRDGLDYVHQKEAVWGAFRVHVMESALTDLSDKLAYAASGQEGGFLLDRNYLFEHSGAYITF